MSLRGPKEDVEQCANYLKKLSTELVREDVGVAGLGGGIMEILKGK